MTSSPRPFADFAPPIRHPTALRAAITRAYRRPEARALAPLLQAATLADPTKAAIRQTTRELVEKLRDKPLASGVQALVQEYALSSEEGVALMCLAEALLRIPDDDTRDALIRDKIADGNWSSHLGDGRSLFVNAATWGLVVTGKLVSSADDKGLTASLSRMVARLGEPVIRRGVDIAMRMMGEQFVTGETIEEALARAAKREAQGFAYSYDMLGEAATTAKDADRYYDDYKRAIHAIGKASNGRGVYAGPGISIKLSALHPRYTRSQADRVMAELFPRVLQLAELAKAYDMGLNIDAEEADRLELSLDIVESLATAPALAGWDGLGFVVQAYGKRCPYVLDFIIDLARSTKRRIMVRLVKGAYWDAEIKRAQVDGLADYPVFTRKLHTDVSYIACARKLLAARDAVFPQFATHNAQTLASVYHVAGPDFRVGDWEFQCLHGMGESLYEEVVGAKGLGRPARIYAPVGTHETLLAYLVRRLLENGANSSFVNRIGDADIPVEDLLEDPVDAVRALSAPGLPHEAIPLPAHILGSRRNASGLDLSDENTLAHLGARLSSCSMEKLQATPLIDGVTPSGPTLLVLNPADHGDQVGSVQIATDSEVQQAAQKAASALPAWSVTSVEQRAAMLERAADALEADREFLMALAIREAGKSAANAVSEVREAVDFLRYYAVEARRMSSSEIQPLGVVVCISPWNFPLAIFMGQISAALVAGNIVLAKPAEETPLIAAHAVHILHQAGVPTDVLQFITGDGAIGAALVAVPETAAVMFTGSTQVARLIQRQLASRTGPDGHPIPLIAETGGLNAMIVDSSALAEQVVGDVIASAFDSAGQRCSALRILCVQEDVADRMIAMLEGAMAELRIGPTDNLHGDIGPVISAQAKSGIDAHITEMRAKGFAVHQSPLTDEISGGTFVAPTLIEVQAVSDVQQEVFGPVLHVVRYHRSEQDAVVDAINAMGYGLTFGLHTRLDETVERVGATIEAGNIYINRNIIGAVVGVQPFGGRGLSGTGPKAGGPLYLRRLIAEPTALNGVIPSAKTMNPALSDLIAYFRESGEEGLAALAEWYARTSYRGVEVEFRGPVGERNTLTFKPRGDILLVARSKSGLLEQLSAVLATDNKAVLSADTPLSWRDDLPHSVHAVVKVPYHAFEEPLAGVLVEDRDDVKAVCEAMAQKSGPIIPVHLRQAKGYYLPWLLEEVSTSINTTAAGGNASLMAIG